MIELTDEQKELKGKIIYWYRHFGSGKPYFYYSGAAGTGKTTVIKCIIDELDLNRDEYIACAYVGKAVLVLMRHGLPATTIHSFIYMPRTNVSYDIELDEWGSPHRVKKTSSSFVLRKYISKKIKLIFLDECGMVNDQMREDLQSFGIPIIMAGDQNQLPPVFGDSSILDEPDYILHQIMRQAEGNPIVHLSQCILADIPINFQNYGTSKVVHSIPIDRAVVDDYDMIICAKNKTREELNDKIRHDVLGYEDRVPQLGDKMICRHNNWDECQDGIYLTNGLVGTITDINYASLHRDIIYANFKPDFMKNSFKKLTLDYAYTKADWKDRKGEQGWVFSNKKKVEYFEYAYAITVHLSQGSEYPRVLFMDEEFGDSETLRRLRYTAVTRAKESITWVKMPEKERKEFFYNGKKFTL